MKRSPWAGHAELFLSGSQRKPLKKKGRSRSRTSTLFHSSNHREMGVRKLEVNNNNHRFIFQEGL